MDSYTNLTLQGIILRKEKKTFHPTRKFFFLFCRILFIADA